MYETPSVNPIYDMIVITISDTKIDPDLTILNILYTRCVNDIPHILNPSIMETYTQNVHIKISPFMYKEYLLYSSLSLKFPISVNT